jgi:putative transposase
MHSCTTSALDIADYLAGAPTKRAWLEVEFSIKNRNLYMKTSRFTDSQIIAILKQAEIGSPVPGLCREHGISNGTFYKWRAKFGGMDVSLMAHMKELEDENRRLKKIYAEERLKAEIVAEALPKKW